MNRNLLKKPNCSFIKGQFWTKIMVLPVFITMLSGTMSIVTKTQAQTSIVMVRLFGNIMPNLIAINPVCDITLI